ncbi:MAG TPA: SDR family oxidoreductase [Candidatus Methylacidiphilales bacterium]|nr:SDR family oxidoreductase [Candidatus Methylacidiphilales bacterium]
MGSSPIERNPLHLCFSALHPMSNPSSSPGQRGSSRSFTEAEWHTCIKVLQVLSRNPDAALDVMTLKGLVTKLSRNAKKRQRLEAGLADREIVAETSLWKANAALNHPMLRAAPQPCALASEADDDAEAGEEPEHEQKSGAVVAQRRLHTPRPCYVCKKLFSEVHHHYHMHCPACAEVNYQKRFQRVDLAGRTALLTGGRIKIGYQMALRLLRDGARVIVTSRFPQDAASRFGREPDFAAWSERLRIYGLDLRNLPVVERFAEHLAQTLPQGIDILINNAAQTIRRQPAFYEHLRTGETESLPAALASLIGSAAPYAALADRSATPSPTGSSSLSWATGATTVDPWCPPGMLDLDGQQVDLRPENSWSATATQVSTTELLEAVLINQTAPFIIACRLRPLMKRSPLRPRFVINVSAMEGQFARTSKTARHPHTNMAKAALNMFTRTSAADFARDDIWMNSVDTGWITDENPFPQKSRTHVEQHFVPPLDAIDGMARLYDPIVRGITDPASAWHGYFLKDYQPYAW